MTLLQDIRYGIRLLVRDPWFTLVAALALGLGIGMNTTVFTFVNAVLVRGLPFDHPDQIFYVSNRDLKSDDERGFSYLDFSDWRSQATAFEGLAAFRDSTMNVSEAGRPAERVAGDYISANAFRLLRQPVLLGRDFASSEDHPEAAPVVILGYDLWKTRFASDPAVLGRVIKVNDVGCTIIGVMPEGMRFPINAGMWRPLVPGKDDLQKREERTLNVFGRLAPGTSAARAQSEVASIGARQEHLYPVANKDSRPRLMTFNERFNGGPIRIIFMSLLGAVGFVLLIACANVANLLLARSSRRAREVAVRMALGAGRARVIRQLLVESTLLACLGGLLGLALSYVGIRLFDAAVADVGKPYWIRFTMDVTVFGYMAAVCLVTGVIFGMAPALQVSKTNVNEILKEGGRNSAGGARSRRLSSAMVVAEITLTLVLLTGASLMIRSFLKLYSLPMGVETAHVLTMRTLLSSERYATPEKRQQFFDALVSRLDAIPGVAAAATASSLPLSGGDDRVIEIEGRPAAEPKDGPRATTLSIGPAYFDVFRLPLGRGRLLREQDGTPGQETIVVNERFVAKFLNGEEPLGRRLRLFADAGSKEPNPWLTIVGVVPTVRQGNPQQVEDSAVLYRPTRLDPPRGTNIVVRTEGDPGQITAAVRDAAREIDPEQPIFNLDTMDQVLARSRWAYRVFGAMFGIFAAVALVLSAVGIYAVTSYSVTQRTPEIGVRMALGAQSAQVSWLILKAGLIQLAFGLVLGLSGGWGVTFVLQSVVAQIPAADPVTFVVVTLLLSLVTVTACLIPAWRAMRLDPLKALARN